ncbi:hypothetical protein [Tateyamaria omphalii]|uniref:Response regulatory domain-containing protein n=1 Tax=Tateyamaria omphalii TaxID=299262 RepID=A0A1P8MS73_9RHOB|nr:hypothetical protein [Tateyamaria omphalii]APX10901.1 hypothetical protein BWR18_03745 [Tateyamaria omphalii]
MTVRTCRDHRFSVVITPNFVEAEDVSDALRRAGFDDVVHFRSIEHAATELAGDAPLPAFAILSFHGPDDAADALCARLHHAGCRQVLIDGDPARAPALHAAFLRRPYSNTQLDRCIADLMRDGPSTGGTHQA